MAVTMYRVRIFKSYQRFYQIKKINGIHRRLYCTEEIVAKDENKKLSGFAKAFNEQSKAKQPPPPETFASLLRNSQFIDLGDPKGKIVVGEIYHVKGDFLYIDFGWKFPTVCPKPRKNEIYYIKGAKVKLKINDLELSARFLGGTTDVTLCEADCTLLGLLSTPNQYFESSKADKDKEPEQVAEQKSE